MQILYTTKATSTGGRIGASATDDGRLSVTLAKPSELGGNGEGTNPEQLFAAGYSACFLGAMQFVAGQNDWPLSDATQVSADVSLGKREDGEGFGIAVTLHVADTGLDMAQAKDLVDAAHVVCPYSHAIQNNIIVDTLVS